MHNMYFNVVKFVLNALERLRYPILLWTGNMFSARRIRIHEGLAWNRNS